MIVVAEDSVRFAHSGPSPARVEATEKLYERHCLVIKIVSSFFASLTKFAYL